MPSPIPGSDRAGVAWPAMASGHGALTLALQYQFRQSERWPADVLAARQFAQLENLLAHAARTMPFWRRRLGDAGIQPGESLTAETWSRIPILSRAEAQDAGAALRCRSVPAAHGDVIEKATSGSTGTPLRLAKTELHMKFWEAFLLRDLLWHGIDQGAKWATLRRDPWGDAGPDRPLQAGTSGPRRYAALAPTRDNIFPTGPGSVFEIRHPIAEQADWLLREEPEYLSTFPTNMVELAQHFRDIGQRPRHLRAVRVMSEAVTPNHRALVREVLGVEILDAYSAEEVGYMALQCPSPADPDDPGLHVMAESVKLEVLDEKDRPCPPGAIGRVVVTPLHNFAMPLIRYELGDYAEVAHSGAGSPCLCGRQLPTLRAIRGRLRHGLRMPDGTSRAVYFGISFARIPAIRQYQAAQVAPTTIELRLATRRALTPEEEAQLVALVRNDTDPAFTVRIAYVDAIPRLPNGKYEEFRCEMA
jgi:phenylacetate-CoA ligase